MGTGVLLTKPFLVGGLGHNTNFNIWTQSSTYTTPNHLVIMSGWQILLSQYKRITSNYKSKISALVSTHSVRPNKIMVSWEHKRQMLSDYRQKVLPTIRQLETYNLGQRFHSLRVDSNLAIQEFSVHIQQIVQVTLGHRDS